MQFTCLRSPHCLKSIAEAQNTLNREVTYSNWNLRCAVHMHIPLLVHMCLMHARPETFGQNNCTVCILPGQQYFYRVHAPWCSLYSPTRAYKDRMQQPLPVPSQLWNLRQKTLKTEGMEDRLWNVLPDNILKHSTLLYCIGKLLPILFWKIVHCPNDDSQAADHDTVDRNMESRRD